MYQYVLYFGLIYFTTAGKDLIGGDGFIQLGTFRLANVDNTHFSISSTKQNANNGAGKTVVIFRNDGTVHPGPRTDFNVNHKPLLDAPTNVRITENGIEFGEYWCLGLSANKHLSITHNNKNGNNVHKTAMIWRNDGTRHGGPRDDFSCFKFGSGISNVVTVSDDQSYVQFNNAFRIGTTGAGGANQMLHMSIVSDLTAVIYRDDGTIHPGPRTDFNFPGWTADHSVCANINCNDNDDCTIDYCDYSSGPAHCVNDQMDCGDNIGCTNDECINGQCVNTDVCPEMTVCDRLEGQRDYKCVRDCPKLAIDEYLTQCSDEFGAIKDDITLLNEKVDEFLGSIGAAHTGGMNAYDLVDSNKSMINDQYKDVFIIGLLLMNMVTMIISCYVYSNQKNKKYGGIAMQPDDEERSLQH